MTIGIDASRANRKRKTGVEWYGYELINALKNIPLADNDIVLYSDSKLNDNLVQLPKNWISSILKWPLNRLWTVVRLSYEMLVRSPSLLFVPSHILPFIIPKYSVVTLHDIGFVRHPGFYSTLALFYHKFSAKLVIKRASKIIAPSEFTKTELVEFYKCAPNKIIVIPHGINWDQKIISDHARQRVLNKYSLTQPYLFYIGRLERKKNIVGLIEAFNILVKDYPFIDLVLVGPFGYGYNEIINLIKKYKLYGRVKILGFTDQDDVDILFGSADMFIFPSFYEGFGMPLLEAMQHGIPVIASDIPACREVAGDAAIFVDPYNYTALSEAIKKLLLDESLRRCMVERGGQRVKKYSWGKCALETYKVLNLSLNNFR